MVTKMVVVLAIKHGLLIVGQPVGELTRVTKAERNVTGVPSFERTFGIRTLTGPMPV